jgi:lysozyme
MTILGIDISKWNGNWDANKAKQAGASFVFIKASQATFTDVQFSENWGKAKVAGLLRGAYHYLDYSKPAVDQANFFAGLLKDDPGELPPAVDYEQVRNDNNPTIALGFLRDFLDQMKSHSELYEDARLKCPMIFTGPSFWTQYGDQTKRDYWFQFPLWISHWTTANAPLVPPPWTMWSFWQFTSKGPGEVFGSESLLIDMNRFNGILNELLEFAGLRTPTGTLIELCQDLEKRTVSLEETVASLSQTITNPDEALLNRVDGLEQQITAFTQSVASTPSTVDQRPDSIEQQLTALGAGDAKNDNILHTFCMVKLLNVRSGPGTSYPVIGSLSYSQQVNVLTRQNGWAQLEQPAGWCYEGYLSFNQTSSSSAISSTDSSSSDVPPINTTYGICNTGGLNVRSGPGVTYPVVGGLKYGQRVKILDRRNNWAQIDIPSGWCNESYLSFNKEK